MKTMRWLKRSQISFTLFVFCGFLSTLALFLHSRTWNDLFLDIGLFSMCGWIVNPFPMIFSLIGIRLYLSERRDAEMRKSIGKRWLLFPAIMLGSVIVFCLAVVLMVELTGGV